jgi:putative molybdopterin biosynthesis protein
MDGIATQARLTFGASERNPTALRLGTEARWVDTGDPLPAGCDAVIMVEDLVDVRDDSVTIIAPAKPWQHVRTVGEDIVLSELVVPENHVIRPVDLGPMLAAGVTEVAVRKKPKVAVIPTGSELVPPGARLSPGDIGEFNSRIIGGLVHEWGGEPVFHDVVRDDYDDLVRAVRAASSEADVVVVNAGSSAGSEDYTCHVVRALGELLVHGVAIKPGKPTILGIVYGRPFLGIPGYPVSASLACELFLKPVVAKMLGRPVRRPARVGALVTRRILSTPGVDEFVRVKLGEVGDKRIATPLARGAGAIMSLVRADGQIRIPASAQGVEESSVVEVELLRDPEEITDTIVVIGSHDLALDVLASHLARAYPGMRLSSAHVGSMGGIMAIRRGDAHLAGVHLIDEETGEYNVPYVKRLLGSEGFALVNLVHREQGFIVAKGNPKGISGFADIARPGVVFVNRQRGAGTRILLDLELSRIGVDPASVAGYEHEEYTHMGVASCVASGAADVGLGIRSAAVALGLDFVPMANERYDLLTRIEFLKSPKIERLIAVMRSDDFRRDVVALGGYDVSQTGKVVWQG